MNKPPTLALIVTHNRADMLRRCIEAVQAQQGATAHILVVNNGSTDATPALLASLGGAVTVITQPNSGGAGGFARGMDYACAHNYRYVWAMDDDVIPRPDALATLLGALDAAPSDTGFVCSLVLNPGGHAVNVPTVDMRTNPTGYPCWPALLGTGLMPVCTATFVSLLVPVSAIRRVGLPLAQYFLWGDDTEFTLRLGAAGLHGYLVPASRVTHLRAGGVLDIRTFTDPGRIALYRYYVRNTLLNTRRYPLRRLDYVRTLGRFAALMLQQAFTHPAKARAIARGLCAHLRFNPRPTLPNQA